jgi:hypothetical protein
MANKIMFHARVSSSVQSMSLLLNLVSRESSSQVTKTIYSGLQEHRIIEHGKLRQGKKQN